MITTTTFVAKVGFAYQREVEILISHLNSKGYIPLIRSMLSDVFKMGNLTEPDLDTMTKIIKPGPRFFMWEPGDILGDLFFANDVICGLIPTGHETVETFVLAYGEGETALQKFCKDIEEVIKTKFNGRRVRGMEFDWECQKLNPKRQTRRHYATPLTFLEEPEQVEVDFKSTEPKYSPEDIEAAKLIVDDEIRQFILKLAQVGKMRDKDAGEIARPDVLQRLLSLRLTVEEYLLTCKRDQHTICVVPSKEQLSKEPMSSLRCSSCGRSFNQENLQVIYSLTERGKRQISHSLWMSIWITELLRENGVMKENIKWGLEANGEELDIMVEDFDSRIFFELKDREFGLGDAYPFVYRTTRYGGRVGAVATTDRISTDAQKFLTEETERREYPIEIRCLEGPDSIQQGIAKLVKDASLLQARRVVTPFSRWAGFDLWPIVESWLHAKEPKNEPTLSSNNG